MIVLLALAAASVRPLPAPVQPPVRYTVRADETLIGIGKRWFARPDAWAVVQRLNRVADPFRMRTGLVLQIPRDLLRSEPVSGKVVAFRGGALVSGRQAAIGTVVGEGADIVTASDASITVELADGSRFSLPSQTRVGIARLRRVLLNGDVDKIFTTARGRSEWRASPAPTPNSRFMVTTPVSVSAVRGTGFRVGYDQVATVGVIEGTVGVSGENPTRAVALPKGQGVAVGPGGVGVPVGLLAAPAVERPGTTQSRPTLDFVARPVAGAASYVFEIGTDAGIIDRVREARGTDGHVAFPALSDGSYFLRVTATDPSGIDGFASVFAFERLALSSRPPERVGRGFRFKWSGGGEGAREYRFTLFADEAGRRPVVDMGGLREPVFTVTDLAPATYWWRVAITRFVDGNVVTAVGELQSLTIAKQR